MFKDDFYGVFFYNLEYFIVLIIVILKFKVRKFFGVLNNKLCIYVNWGKWNEYWCWIFIRGDYYYNK